jgi:hypothetical protein
LDWETGVSTVQRLISGGRNEPILLSQEREDDGLVEEWVGTVELAETVTVPPLAGRIARCRVVRRSDLEIKAPRIIMVEPTVALPGIYGARIVATLDDCKLSSTDARGSYPLVKSSLVIPPRSEKVAGGDRKFDKVVGDDRKIPQIQYVGDDRKTGAGECQPELPDSSLPELDASPEKVTSYEKNRDLRRIESFHPVENSFGNQVDTKQNYNTCTAGLSSARGPGLKITREKQDTVKLIEGE